MSPRYQDILDRRVISLSDYDHLTARESFTSFILLADPGGGKSNFTGKQLFCAHLRAGMGALCLTVKSEDTQNYVAWAKECGRGDDVLVFNEASGLRFDPLFYEWSRKSGRGGGDIESMIDYFSILLSLGRAREGGNNERFWELAAEQAMRNAIKLIELAQEPLSIINIHQAISSFPSFLGQEEEASWRERAYTASLIDQIRARKDSLTQKQWEDLETATDFIFNRWSTLDERPRSSIAMTFAGMADKFLFHPMRGIFAGSVCDWLPEDITHKRRIVITDFPLLEYGKDTARLIQCMVKLTCQRAFLRHQYKPGCCIGAMIYQDEFQQLLLPKQFENHFVQLCRGSAIANVFITQNILNLAEELGETQPGSKTKAFLANIGTKIINRSTCIDTCNYISDLIGKEYRFIPNFNTGGGNNSQETHTSVGGSMQHVHILDPLEFTKLARPTPTFPYAEAIVYRGGDIFEATKTKNRPQGHNYLRVRFSRDAK